MTVEMVNVEQFWRTLGRPGAWRLSRLSAAVGNVIYLTLEAPEDVPGFFDAKIAEIMRSLGGVA